MLAFPRLAAAQFAAIPEPTIADAAPGVDNTGNEPDFEYKRKPVFYRTEQPPGTIIVNTADRFLYLVMGLSLIHI